MKIQSRITDDAETIARLYAAIYRHCRPKYSLNLGHQSLRALQLVSEGRSSVQGIASELGCAANTASELIRRLVARGLATKKRRRDDERVVDLSLTKRGEHILEEQTLVDREKLGQCLLRLTEEEKRFVVDGLTLLGSRLKGVAKC